MSRSSSWSALVRIGPYTLAALIWRANRRCTWCARLITRETCSIDHVIPRARGGDDTPDNLMLACRVCNLQRYDFGTVPPRALRARRSVAVCEAEIARQIAIVVGRGTAANAAARDLAVAWFGAYIERNRNAWQSDVLVVWTLRRSRSATLRKRRLIMIWIGCLLLSALCVLLAVQQLLFARRLGRRIDGLNATFEGPARLELFGHVTHVGWIRQGAERIDLLTIEGEALQCDTRARYRLTPLTWKEFVGECLRRKEEGIERLGHEIRALKLARAESEARRGALRIAIADALEAFNEWANTPEVAASMANKGIQILDIAREKDEEHDALPF